MAEPITSGFSALTTAGSAVRPTSTLLENRAQRRLRLVDVAQVGQRPEAKPTGRPDQHAERSADDPEGRADEL